jgi:polysaccharide biosynthesis protein PslG
VIRATLLTIALLLALAPAAQARLQIGIGEQSAQVFDDKRWQALDSPHMRLVVAWDALESDWQTAEIDAWMAGARREGAKPLISFGHSRQRRREMYLPTRDEYAAAFRDFQRRYPDVRTFQVWNEANHGTQPTWRRPDRAARYFDAMKRNCPRCTVAAPSVLDMDNMLSWIRRFRRVVRRRVPIWSIHNHLDANRLRTIGTRKLLRHTRGQVWFTETGGIVNRVVNGRRRKEYNKRNAVRATKQVFRLARLSRRVTRIYFYHWYAPEERRPRWDSAFIDPNGRARPALRVLKREVRLARSATGRRRAAR